MADDRDDRLAEALDLANNRTIYLIGGGGKTTLMFRLASYLKHRGNRVLTTTSTKTLVPDATQTEQVIVEACIPSLVQVLAATTFGHVTIAPIRQASKLVGFDQQQLEAIWSAGVADYLIVEADGTAGRSIKAHLSHEPVVSKQADLVIPIVGLDCIGSPLIEEVVHRSSRFCELLSLEPGVTVTSRDVARILLHPEGYLKDVGGDTAVMVYLSKVMNGADQGIARSVAEAVRELDGAGRVKGVVWDAVGGELERAATSEAG